MDTRYRTSGRLFPGMILSLTLMGFAAAPSAQSRPQLRILQTQTDFQSEVLFIDGRYFAWANDAQPVVTLSDLPLQVDAVSEGRLQVRLPAGLAPGTYLLKVSRGPGSVQNDSLALTLGVAGPQGPQGIQGEKGERGDKGDDGEKGDPGAPGRNGLDGAAGKDGANGAPGAKGDKGDKGDPGTLVAAGSRCGTGEVMIGFSSTGSILCSSHTTSELGADCGQLRDVAPGSGDFVLLAAGADFTNSRLERFDLRNCDLKGGTFVWTLIDLVDFTGADLAGGYFFGGACFRCILDSARLFGATMNAYFGGASLRGADLRATDWKKSDSAAPNTIFADLTSADLTGANLSGAIGLELVTWGNTTCPDGTNSSAPDGDNNTCLHNLQP